MQPQKPEKLLWIMHFCAWLIPIAIALCPLDDFFLLLDKGTARAAAMAETVPTTASTEAVPLPNFLALEVSEECLQWTG